MFWFKTNQSFLKEAALPKTPYNSTLRIMALDVPRYQKDFADHKKKHMGMKPFECTECGQRFLRQKELTRHKITHTGEKK